MKQFNLKEYLKNPERKIVTRDGKSVRIICTDVNRRILGISYPVCALIKNNDKNGDPTEFGYTFTKEGEAFAGGECSLDLFFAPEKYEGWINIYLDASDNLYPCCSDGICKTKNEAEKLASPYSKHKYVTTAKVEWEE